MIIITWCRSNRTSKSIGLTLIGSWIALYGIYFKSGLGLAYNMHTNHLGVPPIQVVRNFYKKIGIYSHLKHIKKTDEDRVTMRIIVF
jgi:hypothetical protein